MALDHRLSLLRLLPLNDLDRRQPSTHDDHGLKSRRRWPRLTYGADGQCCLGEAISALQSEVLENLANNAIQRLVHDGLELLNRAKK